MAFGNEKLLREVLEEKVAFCGSFSWLSKLVCGGRHFTSQRGQAEPPQLHAAGGSSAQQGGRGDPPAPIPLQNRHK